MLSQVEQVVEIDRNRSTMATHHLRKPLERRKKEESSGSKVGLLLVILVRVIVPRLHHHTCSHRGVQIHRVPLQRHLAPISHPVTLLYSSLLSSNGVGTSLRSLLSFPHLPLINKVPMCSVAVIPPFSTTCNYQKAIAWTPPFASICLLNSISPHDVKVWVPHHPSHLSILHDLPPSPKVPTRYLPSIIHPPLTLPVTPAVLVTLIQTIQSL